MHRHQHGMGDAVGFSLLEPAGGVELGHQHDGAAPSQGGDEADQGGVGIKRGGAQRDALRPIADAAAAGDVQGAHGAALHDALGGAGGAAGIDDVEASRRIERGRRRWLRGGIDEAVQPIEIDQCLARQHGAEFGTIWRIDKHELRARIGDHGGDLIGRGTRGERRDCGAQAQHGGPQHGIIHAGQRDAGHAVTGLHAVISQSASEFFSTGDKHAPVQPVPAANDGRMIRPGRRIGSHGGGKVENGVSHGQQGGAHPAGLSTAEFRQPAATPGQRAALAPGCPAGSARGHGRHIGPAGGPGAPDRGRCG